MHAKISSVVHKKLVSHIPSFLNPESHIQLSFRRDAEKPSGLFFSSGSSMITSLKSHGMHNDAQPSHAKVASTHSKISSRKKLGSSLYHPRKEKCLVNVLSPPSERKNHNMDLFPITLRRLISINHEDSCSNELIHPNSSKLQPGPHSQENLDEEFEVSSGVLHHVEPLSNRRSKSKSRRLHSSKTISSRKQKILISAYSHPSAQQQ